MPKLKSATDLKKLRQGIQTKVKGKKIVSVTNGVDGRARGSQEVVQALVKEIEKQSLKDKVLVKSTGCHGFCEKEPIVVIFPEETCYVEVKPADVPQIVAETFVDGQFEDVGNEGFRRLAAYIKGENRKKQTISMTAPVSQADASENIAMTAPVNQQKAGRRWRITFMMPSKYTMETLPEPTDDRIVLRRVPGQLMASLKYSGTWSRKRYEEKRARLLSGLPEWGLRPLGEPIFARYDPPFMPWFLRRNEVLIPVETIEN